MRLERFSETGNPGLFVIKFAGWLLALLALGYSIVSAIFNHVRKP